jgi:spore coat polysaccharide biosynthesis protein SpsF (cytidylyltransferase family)
VTEIDKQIYENYKLFPNNFIAWDMLNNSTRFKEEYSNQQKAEFNKYVNNTVSEIEGDKEKIKNIALSIYANPINNKADKILT